MQGEGTMNLRKLIIPVLLAYTLFTFACAYIILPEGIDVESAGAKDLGWSGFVTNVGKSENGDLHIDLTIRNNTGDWSAMRATDGKPAVLISNGKPTNCATVFVGTGGHRLAPGFQMRGFIAGTIYEPEMQMIYVECSGVEATPASRLTIEYIYFNGDLDYYHQEDNKTAGKMELELDEVVSGLTYPVGEPFDSLVEPADSEITAISDNVISLLNAQRTETGLEFTWQNYNPTDFPLKTHIGNPPVIGEDGILYGIFEIMDLASVPLTPSKASVEWTTEVTIPQDVKGLYILLSVESKSMRNYVNHLVDITDR
jgi:hypothetical protein